MARLVVIDGERYAPGDAKVSVYDRGFLYGDSVFETIRTYAGALFALDEHLLRLERSAQAIGLTLPLERSARAAEIERAVAEAANAESLVRVIVTRGAGPLGLDSELALAPLRVVIVEPLEPLPARLYREGIAVVCVRTVRASDAAHSAKLSNYLASVLALREARAQGAREALVVNRDGIVVEGTTSNVFSVRRPDGAAAPVLSTPPLDAGVLPGITRAALLRLGATLGLDVRLEALTPATLQAQEEIFLSSSLRELLPVVRVDGVAIGTGLPGPITRQLHRAFRAEVGLADSPMLWER